MRQHRFSFVLLLLALTFSMSTMVLAQDVPSGAEASRVEGQITPQQAPTLPELQDRVISQTPSVTAPAGAENVKFILRSVTVEGTSVYDDVTLQDVYGAMIGETVSLADIYGIAESLTAKYRNEGYILTQVVVPPQTIDGGDVTLQVVEGFIDKISIEGDVGDRSAFLQGFAEKIRNSNPLDAKTLERYTLLINDLAGMSARAVLSPSPTVVGASDLLIIVERKPYDLFFQVDNRGSRYLGPLQLIAGTRLNNSFGFYEGLSLQVVTAPNSISDRELDYFAASWAQPLNSEGTKLTLGGSYSATTPGYNLSQFDVKGKAQAINLELSHPFIRSRQENLTGLLRFNYLDSEREDNFSVANTEDRLRVVRIGGTYQVTDNLLGLNTINAELSRGIDVLNMKDKGSANATRALGDPEFFKATMEISRLQRLSNKFELFGSVQSQLAGTKLLASEEFGLGGLTYGRAYNNSEITGEDGLAGYLELRLNNPIQTAADFVQFYGFYDIGKVWDRDNAIVSDKQRSLASVGGGLRVNLNENFAGTVEMAVPLTRAVETQGNKDPRFFGSLTARF